ncbi:hypothetical protein GCM10009682_50540 [Luedemannella flava]|uniref:Ricin B lectin domain-containing protein n=1 Tax=Luedemannella flava TaxID=349316 RepID=A0ABN2MI06_9ACTN
MRRRTIRGVLLAAALAVGGTAAVIVGPTTAHADTYPATTFLLHHANWPAHNACLEARNDGLVTGGTCAPAGTIARQLINVVRYADSDYVYLVSAATGKCIFPESYGTASGTPLVQIGCGNASAKHWKMQRYPYPADNRTDDYRVNFVNRKSGQCLWLEDETSAARLGSCTEFSLLPTGFNYTFRPLSSASCLDVDTYPNGGLQNGARIQQWQCLGAGQSNQLWRIEIAAVPRYDDHLYDPMKVRLHPKHNPSACLSVDRSRADHRPYQYACGTDPQAVLWELFPVDFSPGNLAFKIRSFSKINNIWMCLNVTNGSLADGTTVALARCDAAFQDSQVWRLIGVAA